MQKHVHIRSRPYLNGAEDQSCIRCGAQDGTVVGAHYSGVYSDHLGRGKGVKADDHCVADLCFTCHQGFDSYEMGNDDARAAEFMLLILKTQQRRYRQGLIHFGRFH